MYICDICSTPFDEPRKHVESTVEDGRIRTDIELLCPICASPYFTNADICPRCGEWKLKQDLLCRACRADGAWRRRSCTRHVRAGTCGIRHAIARRLGIGRFCAVARNKRHRAGLSRGRAKSGCRPIRKPSPALPRSAKAVGFE